eukprot:TRINITY_DN18762_c0_g1_i2.p1 TRINITY_DN18762_c0_g1~~TRINITY_DN18762_c0_g1_i2.p1  ORF type:complete len:166 (+),score=5.42 TRINITY_DN18762_c0_g1_i2:255-752(+)
MGPVIKRPPLILPPEQVQIIRDTYAKYIEPDAAEHALALYLKLFELIPDGPEMFSMTRRATMPHKENALLKAHATRAFSMVCSAAVSLDDRKAVRQLQASMSDLGSRHLLFGVTSDHAPKLREAVVAVVSEALGDAWQGEVVEAWSAAYSAIEYMFLVGFLGLDS